MSSGSIDTPDSQGRNPAAENQFRFVQRVLSDHWVMLAAGTLIGALLAAAAFLLQREVTPQRYESKAELFIKQPVWQEGLYRNAGGSLFSLDAATLVNRAGTIDYYREVVRALVQADLGQGGPYAPIATQQEVNDAAEQMKKKITLAPQPDKQRIEIQAANCPNAAEATLLTETGARVFVEMVQQLRLKEGGDQHREVAAKLEELRAQLFKSVSAEWDYKEKSGFRNYGNVDEDMSRMFNELDELKATHQEIQSKLEELQKQLAENAQQMPQILGNVTDGVVDQLFGELDGLLQEKMNMSAEFQPSYPGLQDLEAEIADKQQTILDAIGQLEAKGEGGSNSWAQRQGIYSQQMNLRLELTTNEIRSHSIERRLEEMVPNIPELANRNLEYQQLVQETTSTREQFNAVQKQERDLRTAIQHGPGNIQRLDSVQAATLMPLPAGGQSVWINGIIGALIGFISLFIFAMMLEVNDTSIRSIEDVHTYIGLDVIGTIPKMRFGIPRGGRRRRATYVSTTNEEEMDACIVTQHDPKSPISEAYRTLRTNFQFATIKSKPKTVMVTSAVPGEGKTTTAANLAVTMADRGMNVLIVDTDLRRPQVHRVLRMERGPGLSDVLRYGMDYRSVIRKTRIDRLSMISSGRVPANPSELIGSKSMLDLMRKLSEEFDIIICDAPSVLVVTDPVLLATQVDTAIMVVSTNNARRETVVRATELLSTANVHISGVVVNGLETTRRHYYYYYYYYDDGSANRRKWYHFLG